jgi:primosomal protein N' (replication factor Y)
MVAKGLDFERVTLVGVMNADVMLFLPDFRASERAFQLLTQVSGRAGRSSERPGEVIIQTSHSKNHAVLSASLHSYDMFYGDEIQHRKEADYPPFSRFIVIEFLGRDEHKVVQHARLFGEMFPSDHPALDILGPAAPTISKLRLDHRRILVIKNKKAEDPNGRILRSYLQRAFNTYKKKHSTSAIRVTVDIDSFSGI